MQIEPALQVSVIIPTYNASDSLQECLKALKKQDFPRNQYEIIVIDDGSTDSTPSITNNFNVRYYYQENKGPAAARNKGVEMAGGNIILFTDADCIPDINWIKEMLSPFQSSEIVGVKGAYRTAQRALWARFAQVEFNERYKLLLKSKYIDMVDTYSAGYRKDAFLSIGGFDTSFPAPNNEDTDLSYRMSLKGYKMVFNPNAIVWHTGHPDTFKKYMKLKFWRGYWRMAVYQKYSAKMIKDSYTPQTLKFQILVAILSIICSIIPFVFPLQKFYPFYFCIFFFIMLSMPFMIMAIKQNVIVGLLSPLFLFLRAFSLGCGVFYRLWEICIRNVQN